MLSLKANATGNHRFSTPTSSLTSKHTRRFPVLISKSKPFRSVPRDLHLASNKPSLHRPIFIDRIFSRAKGKGSFIVSATTMGSQHQGAHQDLLIIGPGVLGSFLGTLWVHDFGTGTVCGQTKTETNHEKLKRLGIHPMCTSIGTATGTAAQEGHRKKFANVVYCAPPSGSDDYVADIQTALDTLWDGTGNFVFTSSAGVYNIDDGSECDESAPTVPLGKERRTDVLLLAEQAVLNAGGCVVRLVGLYHRNRGPHTFFLKQGEVPRWGGAVVNLIHYEDAARLVFAVAKGQGSSDNEKRYRSRVFLGCDGVPVTFSDMMQAIEASGQLPGKVTFTGEEGPSKGKKMSNNLTRQQLGWEPVYGTGIQGFFANGGEDWYSKNADLVPGAMPHQ